MKQGQPLHVLKNTSSRLKVAADYTEWVANGYDMVLSLSQLEDSEVKDVNNARRLIEKIRNISQQLDCARVQADKLLTKIINSKQTEL